MTTLGNIFNIDSSVLNSDWDNLYAMLDNIKDYVNRTKDFVLSADDPGCNYKPWRSPRIGFVSESGKEWTIRLGTVSRQGNLVPEHWKGLNNLLNSSNSRIKLANYLNGKIENESSNQTISSK